VTNSARFDAYSMQDEWDSSNTFGIYTQTLTKLRMMEFALIYFSSDRAKRFTSTAHKSPFAA
jgi:hypothetical protein